MMIKTNEKFVIAVDAGGDYTKIKTKNASKTISSRKGIITHNFNMQRNFSQEDYLVEIDGKKYGVAGLVDEAKLKMRMFTKTKQNVYFDISLLLAIHQYGETNNYVSMTVPVASMNQEERDGLYNRLVKDWEVVVNGEYKSFSICDLKIFPEGAVAHFVDRPIGKTRYLDIGSRTINWCTVIHDQNGVKFINSESDTLYGYGLEALGVGLSDYDGGYELSEFVGGNLSAVWEQDDVVQLLGGGAQNKGFVEGIKTYFPNAIVMPNPRKAAIEGLYSISEEVYGVAKR